MMIGFHLTWTTYGHWFPNDPRGSWSEEVWKPGLMDVRELDERRKVTRPRPVPKETLQEFLNSARARLTWKPVTLTGGEMQDVGRAFAEVGVTTELSIGACAILPNHVHLVCERANVSHERLVNRLKGRSAQFVREGRGIPYSKERRYRVPIWTQGYWVRFIDDASQMECAIRYVEDNPVCEGLGRQEWCFVRRIV
jgi:REP element-mobilizing transposase RayT